MVGTHENLSIHFRSHLVVLPGKAGVRQDVVKGKVFIV